MTSIYDFSPLQMDGKPLPLKRFKGRAMLIVNTASACGFTPQFAGLEALHQAYADKGLVALGFPCNQFGGQDPGSNDEIASFCQRNYGVQFPMLARIDVKGEQAAPLWQWLSAQAPGLLGSTSIKWNFTKFLVGRDGAVIRRYAPTDTPQSLTGDIEAALAG
ncbi:MAG: glutathione peroxidase [Rhodoferax sp.]|nr:glutathione peroxidase [Rhodoferax sp.]